MHFRSLWFGLDAHALFSPLHWYIVFGLTFSRSSSLYHWTLYKLGVVWLSRQGSMKKFFHSLGQVYTNSVSPSKLHYFSYINYVTEVDVTKVNLQQCLYRARCVDRSCSPVDIASASQEGGV